MKCSVSSLIQKATPIALWTVGEDVCLSMHFELSPYGTAVFAAVVPRGGAWYFAPDFSREVRSLGFLAAHRQHGNCYRVVEG